MSITFLIDSNIILQRPFAASTEEDSKCALAVVQPNSDDRQRSAISFLRSKTPVALLGITDDSEDFLSFAAQTAHRNHIPLIVLGSWRFIPAAAALKEIVSSNCLGTLAAITTSQVTGFTYHLFLNDLTSWLAHGIPASHAPTAPSHDIRISITGSAGSATADFALDGSSATLSVNILGHSHSRSIPSANPLASELAVLALNLKSTPKLKKCPLLTTL